MKPCPFCAETVEDATTQCPYCRSEVVGASGPEGGVRRSPRSSNQSKARAKDAVAFGVAILLTLGLAVLLMPTVGGHREYARRTQCKYNLKQIGWALHNYHDEYKSFPPAYVTDENGTPLYSWRVLILPYLEQEQQELYDRFDKSKAWDDPANRYVLENMPSVFDCPSDRDKPKTTTNYAAVVGERCVFTGPEGVPIRAITDGTSNTLMVGEVTGANIPWTAPRDVDISAHPVIGDPQGFSSHHEGGAQFVLADGSVPFILEDIDPVTLARLYERDDGQDVPPY